MHTVLTCVLQQVPLQPGQSQQTAFEQFLEVLTLAGDVLQTRARAAHDSAHTVLTWSCSDSPPMSNGLCKMLLSFHYLATTVTRALRHQHFHMENIRGNPLGFA